LNDFTAVLVGILVVILVLAVLAAPGVIAIRRESPYKWIILILGFTAPVFLGVSWLVAIIWALWPKNRSLIDPVAGNPAGGERNVGDMAGEIAQRFTNSSGGGKLEKRLAEIDSLHARGIISDEERKSLRDQATNGSTS